MTTVNLLRNPLIPSDSISVYTSNREYVSTNAGAMFEPTGAVFFDCAALIICDTILQTHTIQAIPNIHLYDMYLN